MTPQEEAEEMAVAISIELTEQNRNSLVIGDCDNPVSQVDYANTAAWLLRKIPLAELIAVARAAASDKKDEECTCGTDPERSCRYCGYFIRLDRAIQALRATEKVKI